MRYWKKEINIFILFLGIGLIIYFNAMTNSFHYDDFHYLVKNLHIRTLHNIPLFFTTPGTLSIYPEFNHYRPLMPLSYSINYALGQLNPFGYHLVNLGFHVGSSFMVFLIARAMFTGLPAPFFTALAAGLFFLTTPFNSEVVNYITARSSVMCAFFYLLAFWCWVKYREKGGTPYYSASLIATLLAILTKEVAVTLPFLFLLYDLYFLQHRKFNRIRPHLPFLAAIVASTFFARRLFFGIAFWSWGEKDLWTHLLTEIKVLGKYLYSIPIPIGLNIEHSIRPASSILDIYVLLSGIALISLSVLSYILWKSQTRLSRMISFSILWFFITYLPTAVTPLNAIYQENRGYITGVGIAIILGILTGFVGRLSGIPEKRGTALIFSLLIGVVMIYSLGVIERNKVWRDDITLWTDVLMKNPQSHIAHVELGRAYSRLGQLDHAEEEFLAALAIHPANPHALNGLGAIYGERGDIQKAEFYFKKTLEVSPSYADAWNNLAMLYAKRGRPGGIEETWLDVKKGQSVKLDAVRHWVLNAVKEEGLQSIRGKLSRLKKDNPENPAIHYGLGIVYREEGDLQRAKDKFLEVLQIKTDDITLLLDLASTLLTLKEYDQAGKVLEKARKLEPESPLILQASAIFYQQIKRYDLALDTYEKVIRVNPKAFRAQYNKGTIYLQQGKHAKAIEAFQAALRINPEYIIARYQMATVYEMQGKTTMAKEEYNTILRSGLQNKEFEEIYKQAKKRYEKLSRSSNLRG